MNLRTIRIEGGPPPEADTWLTGAEYEKVRKARLATEGGPPPSGPELGTPTPAPVDTVIDLLGKRLVGDVDRGRLHKALDRADAPDLSREGRDKALGRAIRR